MILTLSTDDYLNALLIDEHGRALYHIDTPFHLFRRGRTTITRLTGQTDHDVAWIAWNALMPDEFHQHGRTMEASQRLPRKGFFGTQRMLIASDGRPYVWKDGRHGVKLDRDDGTHFRVAEYHTRSLGFFSRGHPAYIEVAPDGLPILDDIVASFVYIEKKRQQRKRSRHHGASGAAGGASYVPTASGATYVPTA